MVIKEVPNLDRHSVTKRAKSVKTVDQKIISRHTRECKELKEGEDCKITVEKKLTKDQEEYYKQVLADQRIREDGRMKRNLKKKKNKLLIEVGL